ncbi:hypothetical protein IQ06DRAFT_370305 [Phaeosphaeriaceae sp. SRC1lsM3a]|nr:hypothetical protein IQ06DRAFT_370305 [Stagonospora sp. SRC1lsM3a]
MPPSVPSRQDTIGNPNGKRAKSLDRTEDGSRPKTFGSRPKALSENDAPPSTPSTKSKSKAAISKFKAKSKSNSKTTLHPSSSQEEVFVPAPTYGQNGRPLPSFDIMRDIFWRNIMRGRDVPHSRTMAPSQSQSQSQTQMWGQEQRTKNLVVKFDLKIGERGKVRAYLAALPNADNGTDGSRPMQVGHADDEVEGEQDVVSDAETLVNESTSSKTISADADEHRNRIEEVREIMEVAKSLMQMSRSVDLGVHN